MRACGLAALAPPVFVVVVLTRDFDGRGARLNAFDLEAFDRDAGFFEALALTFAAGRALALTFAAGLALALTLVAGLALALDRRDFAVRPFAFAGDRLALATVTFGAGVLAFGLAAGFALRVVLRGGAGLAAALPRLVVFAMILASCDGS